MNIEDVKIIETLIIPGLSIISSTLIAIIIPIYNHRKTKHYDKQWDTLAELYKKLADVDLDVSVFLSTVQNDESVDKISRMVIKSFNSFNKYYLENKIYIPNNVLVKIDAYIKVVKSNLIQREIDRSDPLIKPDWWIESYNKHHEGVAKDLKNEIEHLFKVYLKINDKIKKK